MQRHTYTTPMTHRTRPGCRVFPGFLLLVPGLLLSQQAPATTDAGDPPARVGRISAVAGQVSFQPSGSADWTDATLNYTVTTGDRLYTAQGARAEIEVGAFAARLSDNTDVTITNLTDHLAQLGVAQGTFRISIYRLDPGDSVEIDTPNGALTLDAAGEYRVEIDGNPPDNGSTMVSVDRGSLEVTGPGVSEVVRGGQAVQLAGSNPITVASVMRPGQNAFDQWSAERDRRYATSPCTRYVSSDIPGCADLGASGRWSVDPTYGSVWYPPLVPSDWVPYRYGQWVWVEPWGWTWVDDDPWGFAPFHYGRWAYIGASWAWVPGPIVRRPYYAPALVAFVGGSSFSVGFSVGVQSWFPLGPREPYFPWYHYGDGYLRGVNYTNVRNVRDINAFVHVTNIESVHYVNRERAITAVPTSAFNSGRPIAHSVLRVTPSQIAHAEVLVHPTTVPTRDAALGGRGVVRAPVAAGRPSAAPSAAGRVATPRSGVPATREPPPTRGPVPQARGATPPPRSEPAATRGTPPAARGSEPRTQTPSRLITRTPPPPQYPPFNARAQAMAQRPGRALEPQQIQNLRAGRAAGPPRDPEYPPHAAPAARGAAPARGTPAPARGAPPPAHKPPSSGGGVE